MDADLLGLERRALAEPDNVEAWRKWQATRARHYGPEIYRDWLGDRLGWNRLTWDMQDQAILSMAHLFYPAYRHLYTTTFNCAGISHRLGVFEHVKTGMEMVLVPGGTFMMGYNERGWEKPIHKASTKPMLVGRYPVTQSQWDDIGGNDARMNLPIERVSWDDCKAWLDKAGDGLRLLSESEWEYACRAGSTTLYFWGDEMDGSYCWYRGNVGSRTNYVSEHTNKFNAFGLVDMLGNVWEWCEDGWINNYNDGPNNHLPRNTSNPYHRVIRGGSWFNDATSCRSANRGGDTPYFRYDYLGFRVARSLNG